MNQFFRGALAAAAALSFAAPVVAQITVYDHSADQAREAQEAAARAAQQAQIDAQRAQQAAQMQREENEQAAAIERARAQRQADCAAYGPGHGYCPGDR